MRGIAEEKRVYQSRWESKYLIINNNNNNNKLKKTWSNLCHVLCLFIVMYIYVYCLVTIMFHNKLSVVCSWTYLHIYIIVVSVFNSIMMVMYWLLLHWFQFLKKFKIIFFIIIFCLFFEYNKQKIKNWEIKNERTNNQ